MIIALVTCWCTRPTHEACFTNVSSSLPPDTVYSEPIVTVKDSIVYRDRWLKPKPVKEQILVVKPTVDKDSLFSSLYAKRTYQDSVKMDSLNTVHYYAEVTGTLDTLKLSGSFTTRYVTSLLERNINHYIIPDGVYVKGSVGLYRAAVGIAYLSGKNQLGVNYNLYNKGVDVEYSRLLFSSKR